MSKRHATLLIILISLAILPSYLLYHRYISQNHSIPRITFTPSTWLKTTPQMRGYMLEDLFARHKLTGMSEQSLISLLGKPDTDIDDPLKTQRYMTYNLGWRDINPHALLKFQSVSLQRLVIDSNGNVIEVSVIRDAI